MAILPNMSEPTNHFNDSPETAEVSSFKLAEGDFIVIATDGLWDNLDDLALVMEISKLKVLSRIFLPLILILRNFNQYLFVLQRAFFCVIWRELPRFWLRKH